MVRKNTIIGSASLLLCIGCSAGGGGDKTDSNLNTGGTAAGTAGTSTGTGGSSGNSSGGVLNTGGMSGVSGAATGGVGGNAGAHNTGGFGGLAAGDLTTNQPQIDLTGTGDVVITSAFFRWDLGFLEVTGDLLNTTDEIQCDPLLDLSVEGQELESVTLGVGYDIPQAQSDNSIPCLQPHGTAMYYAIQENIPETLLATATHATYSIDSVPLPASAITPHPAIPSQITVEVEPGPLGWQVGGQATTTSIPLYFLGIDVFPRNSQGLAFDHLFFSTFNLAASTTVDFNTTSTDTIFTNFNTFLTITVLTPPTAQTLSLAKEPESPIAVHARTSAERKRRAEELESLSRQRGH